MVTIQAIGAKPRIYMIACQTRLNSTSNDLAGCKTILASLHFK